MSVCMCVCTPPPLRHDRLTATKFGTHVRIDPGIIIIIIRIIIIIIIIRGDVLGVKQFKSPGNFMNYRQNDNKINPSRWGNLDVKMSK